MNSFYSIKRLDLGLQILSNSRNANPLTLYVARDVAVLGSQLHGLHKATPALFKPVGAHFHICEWRFFGGDRILR